MTDTLLERLHAEGVTVTAAAKRLGVARQTLSAALNGAQSMSWGLWSNLGELLGLSDDELRAKLLPFGHNWIARIGDVAPPLGPRPKGTVIGSMSGRWVGAGQAAQEAIEAKRWLEEHPMGDGRLRVAEGERNRAMWARRAEQARAEGNDAYVKTCENYIADDDRWLETIRTWLADAEAAGRVDPPDGDGPPRAVAPWVLWSPPHRSDAAIQ